MRIALLVLLLSACGDPPPPAAPVETHAEPAPTPPVVEPAPPPAPARLEVPAPSDLAAAIGARLPTIELVPDACPRGRLEEVERMCVLDEATGLPRAMRRFATSSMSRAVSGARLGDDFVVAVVDQFSVHTRYSGRLWRWELREDRYVGLANLPYTMPPEAMATPFGVLLWGYVGEDSQGVHVVTESEVLRPTGVSIDSPQLIDGEVLECHGYRSPVTCSRLELEGGRLRSVPVVSFPVESSPLFVSSLPRGRPLIVVVEAAGARALTVHVAERPWSEVRHFTVPCRPNPQFEWWSVGLRFRDGAGLHEVDLETGAVTDATEVPAHPAPIRPYLFPRAVFDVVPLPTRVVLVGAGTWEAGTDGLQQIDDAPTWRRGPCTCDADALRCGERVLAGACASVEELDTVRDEEGHASQPPTLYDHEGHYRTDRLEPDYIRITRLADGARLWVRVFEVDHHPAALAQADDGAWQLAGEVPLELISVRWGRSLLDAPVTPLLPHRAAFERPTLVADFFGGRPLPTADTTLPE